MARNDRDRIGYALDVIGDQWTLLVLQQAFFGVRRFSDWRDTLGVSEPVLAARLRVLVEAGVLYRRPYRDERRTRDEYRLTDAGLELWEILVAIWAWEYRWVRRRDAELPVLVHDLCERTCDPPLTCGRCGEVVTARDTAAHRAPARQVRDVTTPRRFRRSGWDSVADRPLLFFPETMTIIGDRWSTAVTAAAFLGVRRFSELERELGIRPSVLSQRLGQLTEVGVLRRRASENGRDVRYGLTEKGMGFFPVFALIIDWADRWLDDLPSSLTIVHRACGEPLTPTLTCDRCGVRLERQQVHFARPDGRPATAGSEHPQDLRPSPMAR